MLENVISGLMNDQVAKIAAKYNIDPDTAKSIASQVLPHIINSIWSKTQNPNDANQLLEAASSHDEKSVDDVDPNDGAKIMSHLLWKSTDTVANQVANTTGATPQDTNTIMNNIAPLVMSYLNQQQKSGAVDSTNINQHIQDSTSIWDKNWVVMQMATKIFDTNGDGNITDDLLKKWMDMFFGDKK